MAHEYNRHFSYVTDPSNYMGLDLPPLIPGQTFLEAIGFGNSSVSRVHQKPETVMPNAVFKPVKEPIIDVMGGVPVAVVPIVGNYYDIPSDNHSKSENNMRDSLANSSVDQERAVEQELLDLTERVGDITQRTVGLHHSQCTIRGEPIVAVVKARPPDEDPEESVYFDFSLALRRLNEFLDPVIVCEELFDRLISVLVTLDNSYPIKWDRCGCKVGDNVQSLRGVALEKYMSDVQYVDHQMWSQRKVAVSYKGWGIQAVFAPDKYARWDPVSACGSAALWPDEFAVRFSEHERRGLNHRLFYLLRVLRTVTARDRPPSAWLNICIWWSGPLLDDGHFSGFGTYSWVCSIPMKHPNPPPIPLFGAD